MTAKIRLFIDVPLAVGQLVTLTQAQAHYLFGVMRLKTGAQVLVFDGAHGEFLADVVQAGKRGGELSVSAQTKPLQMPPDLWLVFAPIKKARTDFIVEKAAEMGAARIVPMQTEFTNSSRIQRDRLQAHAVEAAEQCGGTYVPELTDLVKFDRLLADWDNTRKIMFCDEATATDSPMPFEGTTGPWAIFIGPEGGFSDRERTKLRTMSCAHVAQLGPRILRTDTAAVAALTLWQRALGDWQ
ncbi:16S rRNA (uracil(1498)-N(3))-methyltransferase [Pseudosulfitobacter sp. SM2401]|uniref:16S rRNA (uracil(1498)-N(3))-methyltransferase n=1 Tax=Pseudosulfitobacter sp. SM2401 TaxID=3350098 RepID=UPI0036F1C776